jgi:aspartokinase-like uncharacterized kinase
MSRLPLMIVKVGGSLLLWEELPRRLQDWLDRQPAALYVLVAGAGPLGDFVRRADETFRLGQERSHRLCVEALSVSARLLSHLLGNVPIVDSLDALRGRSLASPCVFHVRAFLNEVEAHADGSVLPHTWDVTTDSIAARLAECLAADALVLLKSCDPPAGTMEEASRAGYFDRHFPQAAASLPRVVCVNRRGDGNPVVYEGADRDV